MNDIVEKLKCEDIPASIDIETSTQSVSHQIPAIEKENPTTTLFEKLNSKQRAVCVEVRHYFQCLRLYKDGMGPRPAQLRIILHGGPGTGKSFLAKCIKELANESHFTIGCLAPTGIAASNLPNGRTIHNFCGISVSHSGDRMLEKPTASTLSILKERAKVDTIALLVIDEISNVGPRLFAHVNTRMQHIMENDDAFGDLAVIAMGDFFQLPPVCPSETLCAAALSQLNGKVSIDPDKIMTGPRSTGIHLFVTFRKF